MSAYERLREQLYGQRRENTESPTIRRQREEAAFVNRRVRELMADTDPDVVGYRVFDELHSEAQAQAREEFQRQARQRREASEEAARRESHETANRPGGGFHDYLASPDRKFKKRRGESTSVTDALLYQFWAQKGQNLDDIEEPSEDEALTALIAKKLAGKDKDHSNG